jgi:uncharacterized protein YjbJ (UPF0337 family)
MSSEQNKNTEPTTLGSYVTHGTGLVQETVGNLVGNDALKQQGTANIEQAKADYEQANQAIRDNAPNKTSGKNEEAKAIFFWMNKRLTISRCIR